jgi:hypothetical protein
MLFVHLTDVRNVAHIKKHGFRTEETSFGPGCIVCRLFKWSRTLGGWVGG